MKKNILILWLSVFTVLLLNAQPQVIKINSKLLDNTYRKQKGKWCWAASISNLMRYYGIEVSQEKIVKTAFKLDNYKRLPNKGASVETIDFCLNGSGIDRAGKRFTISAQAFTGIPDALTLIKEIEAQRPVYIAYKNCPTSGHAVLLTGITYEMQDTVPRITSLIMRDPTPETYSTTFSELRGEKHITNAKQFAKSIVMSWYVRINIE